jgi:DNA-binding transcriptional ArsR family regulator
MTTEVSSDLKSLEGKLDQVIALLRVIANKEIMEKRHAILSTPKKQKIFELCDGSSEMSEIAKKAKVSSEYVRLTIKDLEDEGFVTFRSEDGKRFPQRMI